MLAITEGSCGASVKQRVLSLTEPTFHTYGVVGPVPGAGLAAPN